MKKQKILFVDDDSHLLGLIIYHFSKQGFKVAYLNADSETLLEEIVEESPSMIIYNVGAKNLGGLDLCRRLKADPRTQLISQFVVSESRDEEEIVDAYNQGVDAYVTKPFRINELIARAKAILRKLPAQKGLGSSKATNPNKIFSRETILNSIRNGAAGISKRNIDVHIKVIRDKLEDQRFLIETVRGAGYRFKRDA